MKWIFGQQVNEFIRDEINKRRYSIVNVFSQGCVMFEVITLRPLFPGTNEIDQINKIHDVIGTPSATTLDKFQQ